MTDPVLPVAAPAGDPLSAGLAALDRHAWAEAFDLLSAADREGVLSGSDLEHLTEAAFFAGQPVRAMDSKERSFRAYNDAGDEIRAGYLATQIARDYAMSGKSSIASAWGGRAARLLEGKDETYAHGFYARDNAFYQRWDAIARDRATFEAWMQRHVLDTHDHAGFLASLERKAA